MSNAIARCADVVRVGTVLTGVQLWAIQVYPPEVEFSPPGGRFMFQAAPMSRGTWLQIACVLTLKQFGDTIHTFKKKCM